VKSKNNHIPGGKYTGGMKSLNSPCHQRLIWRINDFFPVPITMDRGAIRYANALCIEVSETVENGWLGAPQVVMLLVGEDPTAVCYARETEQVMTASRQPSCLSLNSLSPTIWMSRIASRCQ